MKMLCAVITLSVVTPVHAGIVIYGTRVIYPAEKNEITLQLMNREQNASLVQAWVDDGNTSLPPEKIQFPFINSSSGQGAGQFRATAQNQENAQYVAEQQRESVLS